MDTAQIQERVHEVAAEFARQRGNRQLRRELLPEDFERLKDAGFLLSGVPVELGGIWEDGARSTRPVCELLRTLAHGDSSVALVCAMHPAVLSFWLSTPQAPPPFRDAWAQQRRQVCEAARDGAWWGTITSEPGSGGDVANTRAVARSSAEDSRGGQGAAGAAYRLSGQKHFGSGAGITSYMLTSAVPAGESEPDWFYLDVRGVPWDGSTGMELLAPWDGHGMIATQSHAFRFEAFPASRFAWPGAWRAIQGAAAPVVGCCFTAVIVGVAETAMEAARQQLERRRSSLRPYEQVEWSQAQLEGWLIQQAYEGMLRAVESGHDPAAGARSVLLGKTAIATLAERAMGRLCRVVGGGTYARTSPVGAWFEDVRALGFLRPPWGLAYDRLFESSWEA